MTQGSRSLRLVIIVAVLVVALAFFIGRISAPDTDSDSGPDLSPAVSPSVVGGVPLGYEQTEEGAVEAATNFAIVMASLTQDEGTYREAIRALAAPDWLEEADELADNSLAFFSERYGAGGSLTFSPLRYRVVDFSGEETHIEIWGVTVASGPKLSGIEESWLTGSLDLTWVEGDWRVTGQGSEAGPTPELLQTEEQRDAAGLSEFKAYENAPAP